MVETSQGDIRAGAVVFATGRGRDAPAATASISRAPRSLPIPPAVTLDVRFWGWLDRSSPDMWRLYRESSVFVFPSEREGSPTVVQEDLPIDLSEDRDQLTTRSDPRFTQLRSHLYAQIQQAKRRDHAPT